MVTRRTATALLLALGKAEQLTQLELAGDLGQGFAPHQRIEPGRQLAGIGARKAPMQLGRDDDAKHAIAEEFQPVVVAPGTPFEGARMGQRFGEEVGIGETMAEALGETVEIGPVGHFTALNIREKRIANGQFQTSQNRALPSWEKNRKSARPTRLTAGT